MKGLNLSSQTKKTAHKFSKFAWMRFRPNQINYNQNYQQTTDQQQSSFFSRIKSIILPPSSQSNRSKSKNKSEQQKDYQSKSINTEHIPGKRLKYFIKIDNQRFVIGNQNQIDLIKVDGLINQELQTSHLWSINLGKGQCIDLIAVNTKKPFIAIYSKSNKTLFVYKYPQGDQKKDPQLYSSLVTKKIAKYIFFVKELNLALFYQTFCQVYVFENQNRSLRRRFIKDYVKQLTNSNPQNQQKIELLTVSQPCFGLINIFLSYSKQNQTSFDLYLIQMNLQLSNISISFPKKVYNIKNSLKHLIVIQNYSDQIFLLNIGFEIFAMMKKGYVIDSANVNLHKQKSILKYLGNNVLLHISQKKVQQYEFIVNSKKTPFKIILKSLDSIEIQSFQDFSYFAISPIQCIKSSQLNQCNYLLAYQIKNNKNRKTNGEIQYKIAITKLIKIQEKIKQLFYFQGKNLTNVSLQQIQEKVDMAKKIGLRRKQIYLQLWNRTNKNTLQDYRFLLDTFHYDTICKEIQKKLKKQSMPFTQVYKIQSSCFNSLRERILSKQCNEEYLRNYVCSHFKLRKYQFFRDISMIYTRLTKTKQKNCDEEKKFLIDIQSYYNYTQIQLKSYFLQKIYHYLFEIEPENSKNGQAQTLFQIKILLNSFRFQYKIIYKEILLEVIKIAKGDSLLILLTQFPEILPVNFNNERNQIQSSSEFHMRASKTDFFSSNLKLREQFFSQLVNSQSKMFGGVWPDITGTQWEKGLYLDNILTIQNKQIISQFINSVWFQRNIYSQHDLIIKSKEQILEIHKALKSDFFFYYFIDKIYELIADQKARIQIVNYLQKKYSNLPAHLKGKIHLYRRLYQKLIEIRKQREKHVIIHENIFQKILPKEKYVQIIPLFDSQNIQKFQDFSQFLNLKDQELFKQFVRLQKNIIGTMFHQIKPVYEQFPNGRQLFNKSVQNYFRSSISQITDLKYLLNRLNSEEREYQDEHTSLYQVLVKAVMMKLRIGKNVPEQDYVNIEQLIIYIENISYSPKACTKIRKLKDFNDFLTESQKHYSAHEQNQQLLKDYFDVINGIQQQNQLFSELQINKSLFQIYQNPQFILPKLIDVQIEKHQIYQIQQYDSFLNQSYQILVQISSLLKDIFHLNNGNEVLVYLWRVMQEQKFLTYGFIKKILNDAFIIKYYNVNIYMRENLVLYMYKYKFSKEVIYYKNINFLELILQLLPSDNKYHKFITAQKQLAKILSTEQIPIKYPITQNHEIISVYHLQLIINRLPGDFILDLDLQKLCKILNEMQQQIWKELIQDAQKQYEQQKMKDYMYIQERFSQRVQNIQDSLQFGGIDLKNIQQIKQSQRPKPNEQNQLLFSKSSKIETKHLQTNISQIYQLVIKRLIDCLLIKQCIPLLETLFKISNNKLFIIYPLMILDTISKQLIDQHKFSLIKIACYLFREPKQLLRVIKDLITNQYSQKQLNQFLEIQLEKASEVTVSLHKKMSIQGAQDMSSPIFKRKNNLQIKIEQSSSSYQQSSASRKKYSRRNYSNDNPLIDEIYLNSIRSQKIKSNFIQLIWKTFQSLKESKKQFKEFQYQLINIMLFQQPYTLAKYINMKKHSIDFKQLRSYFSQIIRQPIFNPIRLLQFGKRIFSIIYGSIKQCSSLQNKLKQFYDISLDEELQFPIISNRQQPFNEIQGKLQKSAQAFQKKKKKILNQLKNNKFCQDPAMKIQRIQQQLSDPTKKIVNSRIQYRYNFDDNLEEQPKKKQSPLKKKKSMSQSKGFNPLQQQNLIMSRGGKNLSLILGNSDVHQSLRFTLKGKLSPKSNPQNLDKNRIKGKKTFDDIFFGRQKTEQSIVMEQQLAQDLSCELQKNTDSNSFSPDNFFYKSELIRPKKQRSFGLLNEEKNIKNQQLRSPPLFEYKRKSHQIENNPGQHTQQKKRKSAQIISKFEFDPPQQMSENLEESIVLQEQIIQNKSLNSQDRNAKNNNNQKRIILKNTFSKQLLQNDNIQLKQNPTHPHKNKVLAKDTSQSQVDFQFEEGESFLQKNKEKYQISEESIKILQDMSQFQKITKNMQSKLQPSRKSKTLTTQYEKAKIVVNITEPNKKIQYKQSIESANIPSNKISKTQKDNKTVINQSSIKNTMKSDQRIEPKLYIKKQQKLIKVQQNKQQVKSKKQKPQLKIQVESKRNTDLKSQQKIKNFVNLKEQKQKDFTFDKEQQIKNPTSLKIQKQKDFITSTQFKGKKIQRKPVQNKSETKIQRKTVQNKSEARIQRKSTQHKSEEKIQRKSTQSKSEAKINTKQQISKTESKFKPQSGIKHVTNIEQLVQKLIFSSNCIVQVLNLIQSNQSHQITIQMLKKIQQDEEFNLEPFLHYYNTLWSKDAKNKMLQDPYKTFFQQFLKQLFKSSPIEIIIPLLINIKNKIDCPLPDEGLDYYNKFVTFNNKCKSQLDLKQVLPLQGLFLQKKQEIFKLILQNLVKYSNQNNIYKLSTMVNLVFKSPSFQNQCFYHYLLKIIPQIQILNKRLQEQSQKRFLTISNSKIISPLSVASRQLQNYMEKIDGILMKIPINIIVFHKKDLLMKVQKGNPGRKLLLQAMKKSILKRKGEKAAQDFYLKALTLCDK